MKKIIYAYSGTAGNYLIKDYERRTLEGMDILDSESCDIERDLEDEYMDNVEEEQERYMEERENEGFKWGEERGNSNE